MTCVQKLVTKWMSLRLLPDFARHFRSLRSASHTPNMSVWVVGWSNTRCITFFRTLQTFEKTLLCIHSYNNWSRGFVGV